MGKSDKMKQIAFDVHLALTKKENRTYNKLEHQIPYLLARTPFYNPKSSPYWHKMEETQDKLNNLEKKAYLRWQESNMN